MTVNKLSYYPFQSRCKNGVSCFIDIYYILPYLIFLTSIFVVLWVQISSFAIRPVILTTRVRVKSLAHFCPKVSCVVFGSASICLIVIRYNQVRVSANPLQVSNGSLFTSNQQGPIWSYCIVDNVNIITFRMCELDNAVKGPKLSLASSRHDRNSIYHHLRNDTVFWKRRF